MVRDEIANRDGFVLKTEARFEVGTCDCLAKRTIVDVGGGGFLLSNYDDSSDYMYIATKDLQGITHHKIIRPRCTSDPPPARFEQEVYGATMLRRRVSEFLLATRRL